MPLVPDAGGGDRAARRDPLQRAALGGVPARPPPLVPGQGFIVLRRHCEDVAQLTDDEAASLGAVMRATARAYAQALAPERVHFGLYGEGVRHIHLHVLPRTRALPAGNIPLTVLGQWYELLHRLRLRRPYGGAAVERAAAALRAAFPQQPAG